MNRVTARHITIALLAALALAGCSSATNDQPSQETTTTTTTTETSSSSLNPACEDVADKGRALIAEIGRFATRDATVADVQAAAAALSDAFGDAKATLAPDAQAQLDRAEQALKQVQDALAAQPVDTAALRAAAGELVAAAGDAATLCTPGSSTTGTADTTTTDTTDTTTTGTTTP